MCVFLKFTASSYIQSKLRITAFAMTKATAQMVDWQMFIPSDAGDLVCSPSQSNQHELPSTLPAMQF